MCGCVLYGLFYIREKQTSVVLYECRLSGSLCGSLTVRAAISGVDQRSDGWKCAGSH